MFYFWKDIIKNTVLLALLILTATSCTESEKERQLAELINSFQPNGGRAAGRLTIGPNVGGDGGGQTEEKKMGVCGDGVRNSPDEECEEQDMPKKLCEEMSPGAVGVLGCENCKFNIGGCLTKKVNEVYGGVAETCKCQCDNTLCTGGCVSGGGGDAVCPYECRNSCKCLCEQRHTAQVESCRLRCQCTIDGNGDPTCACSLDSCDLVIVTNPNQLGAAGPLAGG